MRFRIISIISCAALLFGSVSEAALSLLNGGSHAAVPIAYASVAINTVLGTGHVDTDIFVDRTSDSNIDPFPQFQTTTGTPFFSVASGTADNHAVYSVLNWSAVGYTLNRDMTDYPTLQPAGTVYSMPYARANLNANTQPPVAFVVSSSSNSQNGGTGPGIEFALSASYKGLDTSEDSWVSAGMSGLLAALKFNHPTWTWFDIKGALRQTAANWTTGYNSSLFGYGAINWDTANAVASTSAIFLQPPVLLATLASTTQLLVTVYPFRQTRRAYENVYLAPNGYVWPIKNEYTTTDITNSGASLVYTSQGSSATTPSGIANITVTPGTYQLIAFTTDGLGNFSRVESFSAVTTPALACL